MFHNRVVPVEHILPEDLPRFGIPIRLCDYVRAYVAEHMISLGSIAAPPTCDVPDRRCMTRAAGQPPSRRVILYLIKT